MGYPELDVGTHKNRVQLQVLHKAESQRVPVSAVQVPSATPHTASTPDLHHPHVPPLGTLYWLCIFLKCGSKAALRAEVRLHQSRAGQSPLVILPPSKMKQRCVFGKSFGL